MRRLLLALLLGLVAAPSYAADLYYTQSGDRNVYAVSEAGGTPRIVLNGTEYAGGNAGRPTQRNHAGSNGQAFLHAVTPPASGAYTDTELLFRDPTGAIATRKITDLVANNTLKPVYGVSLAHDDSFFGVRATDGQGNSALYKLHASVDDVLTPGYVPPTSYSDPRLELLYSSYLNPQTGKFNPFYHAWSGDGSRVCLEELYQRPDGTLMHAYVALRVADKATVTLHETTDATANVIGSGLQWNPVNDQILQAYRDGSGIFMLHADTPGLKTWALQRTTYKTKGVTVTDAIGYHCRWRNDGQGFAFGLDRTRVSTAGTTTYEYYPSVTSGGWPSRNLSTTRPGWVIPLGWTP